jgi:hypothetical protein
VPIGRALAFARCWDGLDLLRNSPGWSTAPRGRESNCSVASAT